MCGACGVPCCCLSLLLVAYEGSAVEPQWGRLGVAIRRQRKRLGMTQADLAQAAGVAMRTIGNYERGREPGGLGIPDGYYVVAGVVGWTAESVDAILAGGEPTPTAPAGSVRREAVEALTGPAFNLADLARDAGAPDELISRFRASAIELIGWLSSHYYNRGANTLGEGVSSGDAETILDGLDPGDETA